MPPRRTRKRRPPRPRPKGKTVHVRSYCRKGALRIRRGFGLNQRGENMPF